MHIERVKNMSDAQKRHVHYGYVIVAAGAVIWLVGWGSNATFGVFFKEISSELGLSRTHTAGAYAVMAVIMGLLGPVTGKLTDKIGPHLVVPFFGSFLGISYIMMSFMNAVWQFDLIYGLGMGIGLSIVNIPVMTTVSRWFSTRKGMMMGVVQAGLGVGGLIFPPLTAWLIIVHGWRRASLVVGIIALVSMVLFGALLRKDPDGDSRSRSRSPGESKEAGSIAKVKRSTLSIMRGKVFWILFTLVFCFGLSRTLVMVHIAPYITDVGLSLTSAANILAAVIVFSILGRIGLGRLADVWGNRVAFIISFTCIALAMLWAMAAASFGAFFLFALVFGFGWGGLAVLRFSIVVEKFDGHDLGSTMGMVSLGEMIGSVFGSVCGGFLFDVSGNYETSFFIAAVMSVIGVRLSWKYL
jgi:MFS transporter, OFA family, oxalate/formate antiporter